MSVHGDLRLSLPKKLVNEDSGVLLRLISQLHKSHIIVQLEPWIDGKCVKDDCERIPLTLIQVEADDEGISPTLAGQKLFWFSRLI
ncbi:hypothetical protein H5410_042045 [Solanum commersonii]|uniref:Uncharacterized protein n=1 Tax=Solanum commersonii TaxID=4109 RepID=A0A9J5XT80_SOLCO|nr:hypothetical protein H5410_042045 [Solanum commersonii]